MSEVDRLSNSGLYPALPIADRRSRREGGAGSRKDDHQPDKAQSGSNGGAEAGAGAPRPPKSLIDEYA